jgi:biofilm PGA synthesis protein PgaA
VLLGQRWINGARYKLQTQLGFSATKNFLAEADYFNPPRADVVELSLNNEWTLWQRYERSLKRRLVLSLSRCRQRGFQTQTDHGFRYEHQWNWDAQRRLKYGFVQTRQPF